MTIQAIILDIGGVLEITPDPQMAGLIERWASGFSCGPAKWRNIWIDWAKPARWGRAFALDPRPRGSSAGMPT